MASYLPLGDRICSVGVEYVPEASDANQPLCVAAAFLSSSAPLPSTTVVATLPRSTWVTLGAPLTVALEIAPPLPGWSAGRSPAYAPSACQVSDDDDTDPLVGPS